MTSRRTALAGLALLLTACHGPASHPATAPTTAPSTAAPSPSATPTRASAPDDPLSPRPALESPAPVGQPTCVPSALTVTDADSTSSSTTAQEVFVVRTAGSPCQLDGWPQVTLLDAAGRALGTVGHGGYGLPAATPGPVTLSADTTVSFLVGTNRSGSCRQAATLVVTLPGTAEPLRTSTAMSVCGGAGTSPVQRLADTEGTAQTPSD